MSFENAELRVADGTITGNSRLFHIIDWKTAPYYEVIEAGPVGRRLVSDGVNVYHADECFTSEDNVKQACLERAETLSVIMKFDYERIVKHLRKLRGEDDPSETREVPPGE